MKHVKKPDWLKVKLGTNAQYAQTRHIVESHQLHTICKSGRCPNMHECWGRGTATFMIGGDICTRSCKFCNTKTWKPLPLDPTEPERIASSIRLMQLKHAVITSVDRDDLPDLGAHHWVETILQIKKINPHTTIEVLIPDFQGKEELIALIIEARPEIISHNMETVKRLTPLIRSAANYTTSLKVLEQLGKSPLIAKSGVMAGLGETVEEIEELIDDLRSVNYQILTIGQYLQPTHKHFPVVDYIAPEQFIDYENTGLQKGFSQVESGPWSGRLTMQKRVYLLFCKKIN